MPYDHIKSHKKPGFHPLFRRYIFRKTELKVVQSGFPYTTHIVTRNFNALSANPTPQNGWSSTHSNKLPAFANCLSVFNHFMGLAFKGLNSQVTNHQLSIIL